VAILLLFASAVCAKDPIFLIHQIGTDRSEGVAVFDMDRDGQLDVTSGAYWYKGPEWTRHEFREARVDGEFVANSGEHAIDVNRDGHLDIISGGWGKDGLYHFENPKQLGVKWTKVRITETENLEGTIAVDIDGDGTPDILPSSWGNVPLWWIQVKKDGFVKRPAGQVGSGHGVGYADIDGDGKPDILTVRGWYRQVNLARDQWEYHPDYDVKETGIRICAIDVNGDGLTDLIYSRGHGYGLFWMEQKKDAAGKRAWTEHAIDLSASQIHTLELVDLNGDGKLELLAGKRYRGHNEQGPGIFRPPEHRLLHHRSGQVHPPPDRVQFDRRRGHAIPHGGSGRRRRPGHRHGGQDRPVLVREFDRQQSALAEARDPVQPLSAAAVGRGGGSAGCVRDGRAADCLRIPGDQRLRVRGPNHRGTGDAGLR